MAYVVASNIISPFGATTAENYLAVKAGRSALQRYDGLWGLPEPFCASLFPDSQRQSLSIDGLTLFESIVVRSVTKALEAAELDISAKRVLFILSTTKANVELLQSPAEAAARIARHLGFTTMPVVVCNACISGVAAIILAQRLLDGGSYDYAVVCGADVQNRFTVSGFQSLKAVADSPCRPFDMERTGLNLGEAAATMVMAGRSQEGKEAGSWVAVEAGAIRNDAFHISSPSKNGDGAWLTLHAIGTTTDDSHTSDGCMADRLAFINAHGTATMFNDQMESVAIWRAGLGSVPVNGLKGYYGHTLGAAGVLETVISIAALRDHTILATRGFVERGVSGKIDVTTRNADTGKKCFVKMISGFGGGNAAVVVSERAERSTTSAAPSGTLETLHRVTITPSGVAIDGQPQSATPLSLTQLYKQFVGDYPKFYKMDGLCRLGFIASELLLQAEGTIGGAHSADRAIVLFNSSSTVATDRKYMETIAPDNFFPSPSVFVYTLPNIVTGEIAMRNGYHGETSFFILPQRDETLMQAILKATCHDKDARSIIAGWVDYYDDDHYNADLTLLSKL